MPLLAWLARIFFIRRLLGGGRHQRRAYRSRSGPGRHHGRGGFGMFGPVPTYSRRTRGGGRVSVGGCCLPIPLAMALGLAGATRLAARRR